MKKVKKMALGGVGRVIGKGIAGMAGIPKVSNTKPVAQTQNAAKQMQFMSDVLRGAPMASTRPGTAGPRPIQNAAVNPNVNKMKKFMSEKGAIGAAMANPKTTSATRTQSQMQGAANKQYAALRGTMASPRGFMKKGGAVKKATKK